MQRHITQKDGASITPAHAKVARTGPKGSHVGAGRDLMGFHAIVQCEWGLDCAAAKPAIFIPIASGRNPQAGARVDTPSGSSANNFHILSHG